MVRNWQGYTLAAALAWCPSMALAGGGMHGKDMQRTPAQVQQTLAEMQKPFAELIRSAESKTGGKAFCATVCEWKCVQPKFSQANSVTVAGTTADTTKFTPGHPVALVTCSANNKLISAVVCSTTGEVLATRECDTYEPGRSAYLDGTSTNGAAYASADERHTGSRHRWHQAPTRWQKADDVIGKDVTNRVTGEKVGNVKDLAVDPDNARVIFAVVEFDSKMGHGDRWYAMPISSIDLTPDAKSMQIDYTTAQMNEANGFDSKNWPNIIDEKWSGQVYKNFNQTAYWNYPEQPRATGMTVTATDDQSARNQRPRRWQKMSDLIGKVVMNPQNENLGTIKDVTIDPDSGRILYGVLSFGGFLGLGDKYFAIPWSALQLAPDAKNVVLAVDKDRLKNAEGFDKDRWPNMADERWATSVHQFYNRPTYWTQTSQGRINE